MVLRLCQRMLRLNKDARGARILLSSSGIVFADAIGECKSFAIGGFQTHFSRGVENINSLCYNASNKEQKERVFFTMTRYRFGERTQAAYEYSVVLIGVYHHMKRLAG